MDFAQRQRNPTRHLVGITIVVLLHVLVIYALLTGLARKAVDVIKKPLTATIIEEVKLPPPPPPPPPPQQREPHDIQPANLERANSFHSVDHARETRRRERWDGFSNFL